MLVRIGTGFDVTRDRLEWRAPLRGRSIPLRDVTRVRPIRLLWAIYVIEWRGGRPLLVWTGASGRTGRLAPALDALGDRAPHVDLTVGPLLRFSARTAERFDAMSPHSANG